MKKAVFVVLALLVGACFLNTESFAKEHGGKEHGGTEHSEKGSSKEHGGKEHGGTEHSEKGSSSEQGIQEHGGQEHDDMEHGGDTVTQVAPTSDDIRGAMKAYVVESSKETGTFDILDPETGNIRNLALVRVHERVGKTGDYYYSCADFSDVNSGETLDLDLDVEDAGGELSVVDVRIHKLNGKERYTYDEFDNRIPLE